MGKWRSGRLPGGQAGDYLRQRFIDFYYHPYCAVCDRPVQPPLPSPLVCRDCLSVLPYRMERERLSWDHPWPLFATFYYRDPLRKMMVSMKFSERIDRAEAIAPFMYATMVRNRIEVDAVIPVPLHERRLLERGYNQAALLADVIAREAGVSVVDVMLYRDVDTDRQSESRSVQERHRHLADAFKLRKRSPLIGELRGRKVLLVDDVLTTGATLSAAAKPLDKAGIDVVCLVASSDKEKYRGFCEALDVWSSLS
ncbi:MAG TPA: ComF family protein [Clostridiaceae bacterium]|nr:ComF family protein [Clostridiaceae bacterium]